MFPIEFKRIKMASVDFLETQRLIWSHLSHQASKLAKHAMLTVLFWGVAV